MDGLADASRERLLVLLLGGRPPGMFFLAAQLRPALIALIASRDSAGNVVDVKKTLRRMVPGVRFMDLGADELTPPYNVCAVRAVIQHALAAGPELQPSISVTGAPVPMSIAAYQAGQVTGCPVYYVNTNDGEIINLLAPDEAASLEVQITVADYLALYDLAPDRQQHSPGPDVGGHWLEYRVLETARSLRQAGKPVYDDCQHGLSFLLADAHREIDFIGIHAGMTLIASCKTGKNARNKDHLDVLERGCQEAGRRLLRPAIHHGSGASAAATQADRSLGTVPRAGALGAASPLVTGDDLPRLGEILQREMLTPTYPRR